MVADTHLGHAVVGNGVGNDVAHGTIFMQKVGDGGFSRGLIACRIVVGIIVDIRSFSDVAVAYLLILQVFQQVLT